jgi:predicted RNase H-like HicB family nuclease
MTKEEMDDLLTGASWVGLWDYDKQAHVEVVLLTFKLHQTPDGQWAAECVELGVPSFGHTLDEAMSRIREATLLYLNTIERLGDRARIFAERGIKVRRGEQRVRKSVDADLNEVVSRTPVALVACG